MSKSLFLHVTERSIADRIRAAEVSVCYAAPGIQLEPADAIAGFAGRHGAASATVCLDFDERVLRMGYGSVEAVDVLRKADVVVQSVAGLRMGLLIVDGEGFTFTPTALFLEAEHRGSPAPNAMYLSREQATEAMARLSPVARDIAVAMAPTEADRKRIRDTAVEIAASAVERHDLDAVKRRLQATPPVRFDVARQVRVYSAYLQYVEIELTGAAVQRRRITIPESLQNLAGAGLEGRLKTTFDLIAKGSDLSSKAIDDTLRTIRKDFLRSVGKGPHVILKAARAKLDEALEALRGRLAEHQEKVVKGLQTALDTSRDALVAEYLPRVQAAPPRALAASVSAVTADNARAWIARELEKCFPRADTLVSRMTLDVRTMDVTFETLNGPDFLAKVRKAYPDENWDKAHAEYRAAGAATPVA